MKKILYTTLLIVAGLLMASCQQEHIDAVYDPSLMSTQTLGEIVGATLASDGEAITTTFSAADFKLPVAVNYTLFASASSDMADKVKMASSISVDQDRIGHISLNQKDLNSMVYSLGGVADEPFTIYFQLAASMANDKNQDIVATTAYSNIVSATFTAYSTVVKDVDLFPHVWVIGASSYVGSWSFEKVYQFLYDYDKSGNVYSGLIDFGEDGPAGGFKLVGVPNWDDPNQNWGSEAQDEAAEAGTIQLVAGGGSKDIKCYSKRYYMFTYDTGTLLLVKGYGFDNVGIVGAFNGWNAADPDMKMTYNSYLHRFYIDYTFSENSELKFTCDDSWDTNWGGSEGNTVPGGANIAVEAGAYRIYLDLNKNEYSFDSSMFGKDEPTGDEDGPDGPESYEGWGVVGTINEWSAPDIHMTQSGDFWVARGVELGTGDQFKFRKDEDWVENIGATGDTEPFVVELGVKYEGVGGGKNLGVPAAGTYDLYVNPEALTFYVMNAGDVPAEMATWGVVGTINGWGNSADLAMVEENGMLVRKGVSLTASDQFKVRYQNNWDVNRGASGEVEPFVMDLDAIQAVPNGKNLGVAEDGSYDVWYNVQDEVIFVLPAGESPKTWGIVGDLTGWGGDRADYMMFKEGDFFVYKGVGITASNQFKIRYASDWGNNRGAPGEVEPFKVDANTVVDATPNGKNLGVNEDGKFDIYYNQQEEKLYVMAEGEAPEGAGIPVPPEPTDPDTWGVVGSMTGWADGADLPMTKEGNWYVAKDVTLAADDQFKLRGDGSWTFNLGAEGEVEPFVMTVGEALPVVSGGKNLAAPEAGTYDIYMDYGEKQVYLMALGEQPGTYHIFGDYIYAIGGDTDWKNVYPLRSKVENDANTGVYIGFGYLSQEFKFKPNKDNWEGDWEYDGEGKIADIVGGPNCPAPETAGYYMIKVDLNTKTYTLTLISSIGVIGPAQAGGWDTDTDLTYNAETGAWEGSMDLSAGEMKFRANDGWDINWGGELANLRQGGGNFTVEAGTYEVKLFAWCDGEAYATLTRK